MQKELSKMFEKRLEKLSENFSEKKGEFYVLRHRKNKREIYFTNEQESLFFIKQKFNSLPKKILLLLLKLNILQLFLKKVYLSKDFGNVIFVGGQIKCFDLKNKQVLSFPLEAKNKRSFLKSKKNQVVASKKGYAPIISKLNTKIPFSTEELLKPIEKDRDLEIFEKLREYYELNGLVEISLGKFLRGKEKELKKLKLYSSFMQKTFNNLKEIFSKDKKIILTDLHGDFSKSQVLLKNNSPVFIDWASEKGVLPRDLIKYIRDEENYLSNDLFLKILKLYPHKIQKDIKLYLVLNEIESIIQRKEFSNLVKRRINNALK